MNLGPTLVTLGAILGKKSHFYGLKLPIFVIIWSLRTNIEIYIKIYFYLMREYAQCATALVWLIVDHISIKQSRTNSSKVLKNYCPDTLSRTA